MQGLLVKKDTARLEGFHLLLGGPLLLDHGTVRVCIGE